MIWYLKHPQATVESLGLLPAFFHEMDPRSAKDQLTSNYGWNSIQGFSLVNDQLHYPEDPPLYLLAESKLREERLLLFEYEWLAIVQADGSFEVSRVD